VAIQRRRQFELDDLTDARQATAALGLRPPLGWRQGLEQLAASLAAERPAGRQRALAASEAT